MPFPAQAVLPESRVCAHHRLKTGTPLYIPINPLEYHGPHLSVENDHHIAVGLAMDLHARLNAFEGRDWPLAALPDLEIGCGVVAGPGSRPYSFTQVQERVLQVCRQVASYGAKRVVLITFHGDPLHNLAIESGVQWLHERGIRAFAPMHTILRVLTMLYQQTDLLNEVVGTIPDHTQRLAMARQISVDFHAGFGETSLALHYAPNSVESSHRLVAPCPDFEPPLFMRALTRVVRLLGLETPADELGHLGQALAWLSLRPFPGYTGRPHLANPQAGRLLANLLVDGLIGPARDVLMADAQPPKPVMPWFQTITLNGHLLRGLRNL